MKTLVALCRRNNAANLIRPGWRHLLLLLLNFYALSASSQTKVWDRTYGIDSWYEVIFNDDSPKHGTLIWHGFSSLQTSIATPDGGLLLLGAAEQETGEEAWILKIDAAGNEQWRRSITYLNSSNIGDVIVTPDGGYLLGTNSEDNKYLIVKLNNQGEENWRKEFSGNGFSVLTSLIVAPGGGYLLGSSSNSDISGDKSQASKGGSDYWIVKIDASGNKVWDKTIGGSSSDELSAIVPTPDGGYLLGGTSWSGTSGDKSEASRDTSQLSWENGDYWVVKIDVSGNKQWDKTIGGSSEDKLMSMIATPEGGYLLGGSSASDISGDKTEVSRGSSDYWIVEMDGSGNKLWDKTYGGSSEDELATMIATPEGGYLLGGSSASDISGDRTQASRGWYDYWIVEIDASGIKLWDRTYGGNNWDNLSSVIATSDSHFFLAGTSASDASGDKSGNVVGHGLSFWILKLKQDPGYKDQTVSFSPIPIQKLTTTPIILSASASSGLPVSFSVVSGPATVSGNMLTLTGLGFVTVKASQPGDATYVAAEDITQTFLVETFTPLTKQWDKTLGGSSSDALNTIVPTPDGGYLLGGFSFSEISGDKSSANKGSGDYWIVKVDDSGNKQWDRTYGGSGFDQLSKIVPTPDGGYLLGGSSASDISGDKSQDSKGGNDFWLVKIDASGTKQWDKTLGGSSEEGLASIIPTPEGGYLLGGYSDSGIGEDKSQASKGGNDFWIVKIDASGNKAWDKTLGGSSGDGLSTIVPTPDGGYLLGGTSRSGIGGDKTENSRDNGVYDFQQGDYWLVKIDADGNKIWDKTIGGSDSDNLSSLVPTPDGGYLLGGSSSSNISGDKTEATRGNEYHNDYWVVKIDASGSKVWDKTFGGNDWEVFSTIIATPDGGYLLGGFSESDVNGDRSQINRGEPDFYGMVSLNDYWLVKMDESGNKLWDKVYGGDSDDWLNTLISTSDGGYLLGGMSYSNKSSDKSEGSQGSPDYWIIKIKEENVPPPVFSSWDKTFGGKSFERLTSVLKTSDGGYLLGGHSLSRNGGDRTQDTQGRYDYWIVKTDAAGSKLWEQSYGGSDDDYLNQIIATADGGYLLAGSSQSGISGDKTTASRGNQDFWIIKIDANGNKLWDRSYGGSGFEDLMQAVQLSTGEYVLAGVSASDMGGEKSQNRRGSRDYWLLKVSATGQKLWDQRYGGSKAEELGSLVVTADGGFILGGSSLSGKSGDKTSTGKGNRDYWIVRTDGQGTQLWDKSYGGAGEDVLSAMNITTAGVLLLAGHSTSGVSGDKSSVSRGSSDYWLIKTNAQGIKQWDKTYGGNAEEELGSLISTQDGGWLIGGSSFSNQSGEKSQNSQGSSDYWVVKLEEDGEQQWDQTYGGAGEERLRYLLQTEDQGYLLAGFSFSDESGDKSQDSQGRSDYWIVKIPPTPATTEITASTVRKEAVPNTKAAFEAEAAKLGAYPVPFNDNITFSFSLPEQQQVRLELYNSQGEPVQLLFEGEVKAHQQYKVQWRPAKQESNGLYFLQLKSKKFIKQTTILLSR